VTPGPGPPARHAAGPGTRAKRPPPVARGDAREAFKQPRCSRRPRWARASRSRCRTRVAPPPRALSPHTDRRPRAGDVEFLADALPPRRSAASWPFPKRARCCSRDEVSKAPRQDKSSPRSSIARMGEHGSSCSSEIDKVARVGRGRNGPSVARERAGDLLTIVEGRTCPRRTAW